MIDVPVAVKDALRDGRMRKNYRFVVYKASYVDLYDVYSPDHETFTAPYSGTYILYNNTIPNAFRYAEITPVSGASQYSIYCPVDTEKTWVEFELYAGDIIYISLDDESVKLAFYDTTNLVEDFTIDNNNLVSESVSIDERMCSGDVIKFGLAEGSSLEFQYFGLENITGRRIKAFIDVYYGEELPYTIPMGYFTVKKCSRQASTGIIKVTAYNKLQSDYLDAVANTQIDTLEPDAWYQNKISVYKIRKALLADYSIDYLEPEQVPVHPVAQYGAGVTMWTNTSYTFQVPGDSTNWNPEIGTATNKWIKTPEYSYRTAYFFIKRIHEFEEMLDNMVDEMERQIKASVLNPDSVWISVRRGFVYSACMVVHYYGGGSSSTSSRRYTTDKIYNYADDVTVAKKFSSFTELDVYNVQYIEFYTPTWFQGHKNGTQTYQQVASTSPTEGWEDTVTQNLFKLDMTLMSDADKILLTASDMPDVTLRDIISSTYETQCLYGQLDRETDLFSGVELNHSRLLPADTLYPATDLYPDGAQESAFRSQYSKLWADEGNVHKWRYLIITYKGLDGDGNEAEFTLQRTVNADGTDDYNCSDNWLFKNLVWIAGQISTYASAMVLKMQDITWFPFEMWCAGLPYLETGDEIEIPLGEDTYTSYILQRQLKGIQNLQDTYINGTLDIF